MLCVFRVQWKLKEICNSACLMAHYSHTGVSFYCARAFTLFPEIPWRVTFTGQRFIKRLSVMHLLNNCSVFLFVSHFERMLPRQLSDCFPFCVFCELSTTTWLYINIITGIHLRKKRQLMTRESQTFLNNVSKESMILRCRTAFEVQK